MLADPQLGTEDQQQISSSSWLQEASRSPAVPPCWCLVSPQPGSWRLQHPVAPAIVSSSCFLHTLPAEGAVSPSHLFWVLVVKFVTRNWYLFAKIA